MTAAETDVGIAVMVEAPERGSCSLLGRRNRPLAVVRQQAVALAVQAPSLHGATDVQMLVTTSTTEVQGLRGCPLHCESLHCLQENANRQNALFNVFMIGHVQVNLRTQPRESN